MSDNANTDQLQVTHIAGTIGNSIAKNGAMPSATHTHEQLQSDGKAAPAKMKGGETATVVPRKAGKQIWTNLNNLRLTFSHINYVQKQSKALTTEILHDVCGEFRSGRLTAVLGPSGAGKTSLLNVLSGFKASGVTGNLEVNGEKRNIMEFRNMSSYIPQNFAMLDLLTVYETLMVSTDLKLEAHTSLKEKEKIIKHILEMLNMKRCRNTLVGKLSGGERKRLSIGIELVTNPPIMFFDEPTSGLDSVSSLQLMTYLRKLATDGRLIVCVVHQPSSRLMQLFDDIVVLAKGNILYSGPQQEMLDYFKTHGFECPRYYNPADFVLEVSSDWDHPRLTNLIEDHKQRHYNFQPNTKEMSESSGLLVNASSPYTAVDITPAVHNSCEFGLMGSSSIRPKEQVSVWRQYTVLLKRSVKTMFRNMESVQLRVIMHIFVAFLLGIVYWQVGNDAAKTLTNSSCLFFVLLFIFFGNAMPSIFLCSQECLVFLREYMNGWYSVKAYYLAKMTSDLPLQFICPTLMAVIAYFMTGQSEQIERFAMFWGICLLTAMIGHFLGLMFGTLCGDIQMAVFLVPNCAIPMLIFSGFFIRVHEVSSYLRFLCDISFFRYAMAGILRSLYAYDRADLECNETFCYYRDPKKFLKDFSMEGELYGQDVCALVIWIIALKVMFLLSLWIRIKRAQ